MSTTTRASGLIDDDGFMWATVPALRANAHPGAVEEELETQIAAARSAGIVLTHLDYHMGGALAPEFAETTIRVAGRHRLPFLLPADPAAYAAVLNWGPVDLEILRDLRDDAVAAGAIPTDRFLMGLTFQDEAPGTVYRRFMEEAAGLSFLSMHCNAPGEVWAVHPNDAAWRVAEYEWARDGATGIPSDVSLSDFRKVGSRWGWNATN
jgi:hypothetical protein